MKRIILLLSLALSSLVLAQIPAVPNTPTTGAAGQPKLTNEEMLKAENIQLKGQLEQASQQIAELNKQLSQRRIDDLQKTWDTFTKSVLKDHKAVEGSTIDFKDGSIVTPPASAPVASPAAAKKP